MKHSSPYLNFDFQKEIIAEYKRIIDRKTEFILKNRMDAKIIKNLIHWINYEKDEKKWIERREKYNKIQEEEINREEAIDFFIKKKIGFGGGFGIHVSYVLRKMCMITSSEARKRVEDEMCDPCTPETSDDESA